MAKKKKKVRHFSKKHRTLKNKWKKFCKVGKNLIIEPLPDSAWKKSSLKKSPAQLVREVREEQAERKRK